MERPRGEKGFGGDGDERRMDECRGRIGEMDGRVKRATGDGRNNLGAMCCVVGRDSMAFCCWWPWRIWVPFSLLQTVVETSLVSLPLSPSFSLSPQVAFDDISAVPPVYLLLGWIYRISLWPQIHTHLHTAIHIPPPPIYPSVSMKTV